MGLLSSATMEGCHIVVSGYFRRGAALQASLLPVPGESGALNQLAVGD